MTNLVDNSLPDDLNRLAVSGVGWTAAARYIAHVIGFGSSVLLARLIEPAIFGWVGMLTLAIGFAAILIDLGLGSALIQKRQLNAVEIDTAFWTSLGLGISVAISLAWAARPISSFFGQPELVPLIHLACLGLPFTGLGTVPNAVLVRRLEIRSIEIVTLIGTTTGVLVTVVLALMRPGPFPLVIGPLTGTILTSLGLFAISRVRPTLRFRLDALQGMARVALFRAGFDMVNFCTRNVDNLLIGRFLGAAQLAFYSRAYTLMMLPVFIFNNPMAKTLTSVLARLQDDVPRSKKVFLKVERLMAFISFPSMIGLSLVADPLVRTLYGDNWIPMIPLLTVLGLAGLFQGITGAASWVFVSQGRTDLLFKCEVAQALMLALGCSLAVTFGSPFWVAIAFATTEFILVIPILLLAGRLIDVSLHDLVRAVGPAAICSLMMGVVVWIVADVLLAQANPLARLSLAICTGVTAYAGLSIVFQQQTLRNLNEPV
jgi:PST family polysaccharide transporter